jgi:long-chain acyl-CoA synthetase
MGRVAVLLTGATGFLGAQIARRLLEREDLAIVALVRARDREIAERSLSRAWWDWADLVAAIGRQVEVIAGDVSAPRLGLDATIYAGLARRLTHIIHTAADVRIGGPAGELRRTNVDGTANVLDLARAVHRDHGLGRLAHVSTAYVAGGRRGVVLEEALTDAFGFESTYELTKFEAERLVRGAESELPVSVFRPGMIVGDSRTGEIKTFNTFYVPLRLYLAGQLRVIPASPGLRVNIVPIDYVADAIARLTFEPSAEGLTFHLTAPRETLPTAGDLVRLARGWAAEALGVRLPRPIFIPMPRLAHAGRIRDGASASSRAGTGPLQSLMPYLREHREFRRDNTDRLLGPYAPRWREYLPQLLRYAASRGFLHRSDRTVHEQIIFRLGSTGLRVRYHDVSPAASACRSAAGIRQAMLDAAGSLRAMGVRAGSRVAVVGLNSARYLTVDVAIGLVGAVSVPLYATSPPHEIDDVLRASEASLFFVGAPDVLRRLGEIASHVPVVSFCEEAGAATRRAVMGWDEFLSLAAERQTDDRAPVGFGDVATLRYTSGTTGRPKGVAYTHAQLRWMAETLVALMPWEARTRHASYLSFLPMNHVVEGILGTYAPYYLSAPVDITFLADFRQVEQTLPQVRPTIFFCVPRLYEKVWEGLAASEWGRRYLSMRDGLLRHLLRRVLRRQVLRIAGLDRCAQLIVGSAPVNEDLLRAFRELGVEVHNAYGLTEAPLVTLNRRGRNRLGTVGEPLPDTDVRIAEDGEVLVRGPQVTIGYADSGATQPFREGWLETGDLGRLTDDGALVIEGRKKDLLKTAYGKYVQAAKVEAMLREIPGVSEAMVVAEGRPFATALLWIEGAADENALVVLDRMVEAANRRVSHPEQVKRWAVLANDLSIEGGELTPNFKLRRRNVAMRFQSVIEDLYAGAATCAVLHVGGARQDERVPA